MHYQHQFHAGNFADVFKHTVLVGLLQALSAKRKPWFYLDTHAGVGLYVLQQAASERTGEWRDGIGRLWCRPVRDAMLADYLGLVAQAAEDPNRQADAPQRYPGSSWLASRLARPGDRVVACELIPEIEGQLRALLPSLACHRRDGYEAYALLPPAERRGLVLVDPPFERADEFDAAAAALERMHQRFPGGVLAFWYPLKNAHAADRCLRRIARGCGGPVLDLRLDLGPPAAGRMHACGLVVVNVPYRFSQIIAGTLTELAECFGPRARVNITPITAG